MVSTWSPLFFDPIKTLDFPKKIAKIYGATFRTCKQIANDVFSCVKRNEKSVGSLATRQRM